MARKSVTLKIEGMKDLQRKLRRLGKKVFKEIEGIVEDAAEILVTEAKARAPVDTGRGRDSIHASKAFGARGKVTFDVGPSKDGFHLKFKEYGTRFQAKKPWLRPAADAAEPEVGKSLVGGLHRVLSSEDE